MQATLGGDRAPIEAAIAALQAQRALLGDALVDLAQAALQAKLAALASADGPAAEPLQSLRQVTILFLDVVGSTTLSQHLDPEGISAVMDGALSRGTAVVGTHGGKVLQYAGDNILAAFGVDEAHEDDAERAVHCGLALLALGTVLGAEVKAAHGHSSFDVRVGIHTGGVLLGGGVDADGSIRGIAVNIAARMEQTAPAGTLRISHDTCAQVRGLFELDAQPPLAVKGVDAPVQSYLVRRAWPRQFRTVARGIEGVVTRMIGRDTELAALQAAYRRLFEDRRLAAVTVTADAGIGKSRLLGEFGAWCEAQPEAVCLFRGRATPQTGMQAFGLLRDLLAWRFQINDDDSLEAARRKMQDAIVPLFIADDGPDLAEGHAHLLGHLIGIEWRDSRHIKGILDDPRQIRSRAFHAAAQLFRRLSASRGSPVVLQLEDLHWADNESLDFLNHLCRVNRDVPLLLLAFTRPSLFERRTDWGSTEGIHQRIDLAPLDRCASRLLASELLKKLPGVPAALQDLLTSRADGNPFYMEELVKMLINRGAVVTGQTWAVDARRLLVTQVPSTLTGVLQARLDGLPVAEKRALQQASVVGAVFWDQALAAIEAQAAEQLPALVQRELALPRNDAPLNGLREYAFHHQLLHQVVYDTVLRRHKREGHARVAQWLARLAEQGNLRGGDFLGLAAEHFEHSGDEANAAEFHARAAEQAGERFAHDRVLAHVGRAMAILGDQQGDLQGDPQGKLPGDRARLRWRLLAVRERTWGLQARRDQQADDLAALAHLADVLADDHRRAYVAWRRSFRAMRMAEWSAMEGTAAEAMRCATRAGDDSLRLNALRLLAVARLRQGDGEAARSLAQDGLAEARRLGLREVEARLLNALSVAAAVQGDVLTALDLDQRCLAIHRDLGDHLNQGIQQMNVGNRWLSLGHLLKAEGELDAALQLARANGNSNGEAGTLNLLSILALWQGDPTRARAHADSALSIALAGRSRDDEAAAHLFIGHAELALQRPDTARQCYLQAQALSEDSPVRHDAAAGVARAWLAQGDASAARAALDAIWAPGADAHVLDGTLEPRLIEFTCWQTLCRAGDSRAAGWLAQAHTTLLSEAQAIVQIGSEQSLRQGFLHNIPYHHEIVAAWEQHGQAALSPPAPWPG